MLQSLTVQQFALIERMTVNFHGGMNALSGETGAGKSLVVDAVNLILGARADKSMIRSGSEKASVEAVFHLPEGHRALERLAQEEIDPQDGELVAFREITEGGRNACRLNGVLVSLAVFREITSLLMDLHGQNDHVFLNDPEQQLAFLDRMGGDGHQALLQQVRTAYEAFIRNHRAYARMVRTGQKKEERIREIERELKEIDRADPASCTEESLREEYRSLRETEKCMAGLSEAGSLLSPDETGEGCVEQIQEVARLLRSAAEQVPSLADLSRRCDAVSFEIEEISFQLSKELSRMEADPERIGELEERLNLFSVLRQRYGDEEKIRAAGENLRRELETLNDLDSELKRMAAEHKKLLAVYRGAAEALGASRRALAETFVTRMKEELSRLGMEQTVFRVDFAENETGKPLMPTAAGDDRIEFLMSPNPGEPLKPMAKIASGGELSRIMLAVKVLESGAGGRDAMVFDEIDTGISGRMAQAVAEKMIAISRNQQVICVTHLPQIASAADHQYLVYKEVADGRTHTRVRELDADGRVMEVARMISGAEGLGTQAADYARSMLRGAEQLKESSAQNKPG